MQESFLTVKHKAVGELVEKKSRFIATVFCIKNEEDANEKINEIKKLYRDARHNVYAYRLNNGFEKCSDDGEPSGTGGIPILDILRGEKLFNVLIVVTRYFGGILLGTGGLVRSYSGAAKLALENTSRVEMKLCSEYKICINYDYYNIFQHYCKNNEIKILDTDFSDKIVINVLVVDSFTQKFLHDLSEITNRTAGVDNVREYYSE